MERPSIDSEPANTSQPKVRQPYKRRDTVDSHRVSFEDNRVTTDSPLGLKLNLNKSTPLIAIQVHNYHSPTSPSQASNPSQAPTPRSSGKRGRRGKERPHPYAAPPYDVQKPEQRKPTNVSLAPAVKAKYNGALGRPLFTRSSASMLASRGPKTSPAQKCMHQ